MLKSIFRLFSLSGEGDVPVGLYAIRDKDTLADDNHVLQSTGYDPILNWLNLVNKPY